MKRFKYILPAALLGVSMVACDDDDTYEVLDGMDMILRSQSIADSVSVRPNAVSSVVLAYNNLVAFGTAPISINGEVINAVINPENGMEVILPIALESYKEYSIEIPQGAILIKDKPDVSAPAKTIVFDTNLGIDNSKVATQLTNPNASSEAKAVYNYLLTNYGKTQLSGAMGDVAWDTRYVDLVAQESGYYPAIVGFDYIHLASSPSNWIDYGDITPVKNVWDNGCIPAFTWHWNTPYTMSMTFNDNLSKEDVAMGNWEGNINLTDEESMKLLGSVLPGCTITVNVKDVEEGAQGSFKDSSWTGLVADDGTSYEYFPIEGDSFTITLDAKTAAAVSAGGIIISGQNYTATSVKLTGQGGPSSDLNAKGDFDAAQALIAGTAENVVFNADIAKVAGYLTLLKDANIPVIWRPFHEAAGDYGWGAWFWWGKSGVETTKQLWKYLRDKLEGEYGLNNLIWVWTIQTSDEGKMADMKKISAAYPGNDIVDIVGLDLYEDELSTQTEQFDVANELVKREKIIALSECGNLLDPQSAADDRALWSWFMQWYALDEDGNPAFIEWSAGDVWKQVMESPYVLNRGDFNVK